MSGTEERQRALKVALLRYFEIGHSLSRMTREIDQFPGFTADELKDTARGLIASGFLKHARGRTRAATYVMSRDGKLVLDLLENDV
jgi:hypothetical protein